MLRPVDFPEPDRLVTAWRSLREGLRLSPDRGTLELLQAAEGVFDDVLGFAQETLVLSDGEDPLVLPAAWTEPGFFEIAGTHAVRGRLLSASDEGTFAIVISEGLWRRLGEDPALIGGTLRLDGELHTVVGVVSEGVSHPSPLALPPDIWLPLPRSDEGRVRVSALIARLADGVTVEEAGARVAGLDAGPVRTDARGFPDLVPEGIELVRVGDLEARRLRDPVVVLMAAVLLLLALSWASVAGLLLARGEARDREAAVRAALGASSARLVRQQILEGLAISGAAAALGVALARAGIGVLRHFRPDELRLLDGMRLDARVLAFAAGSALVATLLIGALPILRTGRGWVAALLRGGRSGAPSGARARRALVVVEVALSFTLLVGVVQLVRTLAQATARDPGFSPEGLLTVEYRLPTWRFPTSDDRAAVNAGILERVRALPGVEAAALGAVPPRIGIFFGVPQVEGAAEPDPGTPNEVFFGSWVGAGWAETLRLPVIRGRGFQDEDGRGPTQAWLLGERLARRLVPPDGDVVGKRIRIGRDEEWGEVVGVVKDVLATGGLTGSDYDQLWQAAGPSGGRSIVVRGRAAAADRAPAATAELAPALRAAIRAVDPEIPIEDISTVESQYRATLARERLAALLLSAFAGAAALLSVVGLYGVLTQVVRVRLREFGIRLSLGAAPGRIFARIVRGGGVTVAAGLLVGAAAALGVTRLLGSRIPGLDRGDPLSYLIAALLLGGASMAATALPALRASRADPVEVLRSD
jgi:predicted permease